MMVVSRAARKTEAQRESMMIVVSSAVREASGFALLGGGEAGGGFAASCWREGSSFSMEAEEESLLGLPFEELRASCWCFSSI